MWIVLFIICVVIAGLLTADALWSPYNPTAAAVETCLFGLSSLAAIGILIKLVV